MDRRVRADALGDLLRAGLAPPVGAALDAARVLSRGHPGHRPAGGAPPLRGLGLGHRPPLHVPQRPRLHGGPERRPDDERVLRRPGGRRAAGHRRRLGGGGDLVPDGGGAHRQPGAGVDPTRLPGLAEPGRGVAGSRGQPRERPLAAALHGGDPVAALHLSRHRRAPGADRRRVPRLRGPGSQRRADPEGGARGGTGHPGPARRRRPGGAAGLHLSARVVRDGGGGRHRPLPRPQRHTLGRGGPGPSRLRRAGSLRCLDGHLCRESRR